MRLELTTYSMASCRSSQLSYARVAAAMVDAGPQPVQRLHQRRSAGCRMARLAKSLVSRDLG